MTTHGRYDWSCNVPATIYGLRDSTITLFPDFECTVEIECFVLRGELSLSCTDVLVDGKSLKAGDALAQGMFRVVSGLAEAEIEAGGWLFEQVSNAEGLSLTGVPGDPDAAWTMEAAE